MRQFNATVSAAFALVSLILVAHAQGPATPSTGRASRQTYHMPRTPWGDPDLEGKWPGSLASSIPLQRAESLGTRNTLNDAEFADRLAQAERQKDQDVADFDFDHPSIPFGQVGGGQSPPQHWFERAAPQRQASLIVDPPNGRLPAMTPAHSSASPSGARVRAATRPRTRTSPSPSAASRAASSVRSSPVATTTGTGSCSRPGT
jgi:hypothetical protein